MQITIDLTEKQLEMLERETDVSITDYSGEYDEEAVSYAIGVLIEQNEVD